LGKNGAKLGGKGPPTLAGNWIDNRALSPYHLVEGRAPRAGNEVVINRGAANNGNLHVGDTTTVQTPEPVPVTIVGISKFGSADGLGGVTFTAFTLESALEHLLHRTDQVTSISVKAQSGVSQDALVNRIQRALPADVQAITGARLTNENTSDINKEFLDLFTTFLVVFAGVALLVATFSIYNTFSIIVAQRTRESALLRASGVAVVLGAVLSGGGSVLALAGLGAVLTMVGVVVFGPVVARPASRVIGAPLRLLRGVTGSLARENAMRNPRRTSGTAAAL